MACPGCQSGNTEKLSHYWESLPAESPLKVRYAPPAVLQVRVLAVLAVMGVGIWIAVRDEPLYGLLIAVGGLLWGIWMTMGAVASQAARDSWSAQQLCLSCTKRWE
jgi:hypothetical protein